MKRYFVVSPGYESYGRPYGDPPEPPEYGCDVLEIEADSKRTALILGVREMLTWRESWAKDNRDDGLPPWAGYRVEEVEADAGVGSGSEGNEIA